MNTLHSHPQNVEQTIFGRFILPGEVLQKGDMYDSTTGKWEPVSNAFIGNVVEERHGAMFIRPAE